jgi:hypothetical protein
MYESLIAQAPPIAPSSADLAILAAHCRVDASDTQASLLLPCYLQAARAAANSYLKQTFYTTSYTLVRDLLPSKAINGPTASAGFNAFLNSSVYPYTLDSIFRILNPPLISVDSITYLDTSGTEQTLDTSFYVYVPGFPGRIAPAYGKIWPFTLPQLGSVTIKYTCGYGSTSTVVTIADGTTTTTATTTGPGFTKPLVVSTTAATVASDVAGTTVVTNVPPAVTAGVLLWAGSLFMNREAVSEGVLSPIPYGVKELFDSANRGYYR